MTPARFPGSRSAWPGLPDSFVFEPQQLAYALPSQHLPRAFHRTGSRPLFHPLYANSVLDRQRKDRDSQLGTGYGQLVY